MIWRGFYILRIPGFATKARITLNWVFDYIFPRSIVYLQQQKTSNVREVHFSAGDVMFHKDQLLDALCIVKSGRCELRDGKGYVREFVPGDHFGERLIERDHALTGEFVALEDSVILKFDRDSLSQLRDTMPILDKYFKNIDQSKYTPEMRD